MFDFLTQDGVLHGLRGRCRREVLEKLSERAEAITGISSEKIYATLLEREQLGSTGVGDGVAIPHGKLDDLGAMAGVLATLDTPVSFDSLDDQPVDIVFMLLAPANATAAHLKTLAKVSRLLRDPETRDALRGADSAAALHVLATTDRQNDAA